MENIVNAVNLEGGCLSYCREVNKLTGFEILPPEHGTEWTEATIEQFALPLTFLQALFAVPINSPSKIKLLQYYVLKSFFKSSLFSQ